MVQANLRNIGLNMDIKLFPRATQFELAGRKGEPFDMTLEDWHMDYFDPYDFIFLVDGTTIRPANNVNFSYFNSAAFNKKITRAKTLVGVERYRAFRSCTARTAPRRRRSARSCRPTSPGRTQHGHPVSSVNLSYFNHPAYNRRIQRPQTLSGLSATETSAHLTST